MEDFVPQLNSLVKYSTPVLVSVAGKSQSTSDSPNKASKVKRSNSQEKQQEKMSTQEILTQNLPPKEYRLKNGQLWIQTVLSTPATRTEVIQLQQELDKRLQQRQARETGICPIREELYEQCFDELIRQITIDCSQRGLLLVKVRNEFKNQLNAYKTLYESSIAYGMRKMIDAEQKKTDKSNKIMLLERECQELNKAVEDLDQKIQYTKKVETERMQKESDAHKTELEKQRAYLDKLKEEITKCLEGRR
ncbi:28 kDa inner dynein arm light chain [Paramecium bursaria]